MKKETLLEIILGTIGGLVFAIGMCMGLIKEWDMLIPGIVIGIIGFIILLCIIPIYKKNHSKQIHRKITWKISITWIVGILGSLIMGFGMSKIIVGETSKIDIITGMIIGVIGLIICVLNYPIYSYLKEKHK